MDEILVKYILDEASATERKTVEDWLKEAKENQKHFEHIEMIWQESNRLAAVSNIDENEAWQKFKNKIANSTSSHIVAFPKKANRFSLKAVAALLVLMLGACITYFALNNKQAINVVTATTNIATDTLPDGTVITLNKNSSISYPNNFEGNTRAVTLHGEAFFDVTPDKTKPFIIDVDGVAVTVVGTSFNIKSSNEETEIIVETGEVTVAKDKHIVTVLPQQQATVSKANGKPVVAATADELHNYYRTKEFVCNNTPLWKLIAALNSAYSANIVLENKSINNLPLTTTFKEDSLNEILNTVVQTFNLTIIQRDGKIILK